MPQSDCHYYQDTATGPVITIDIRQKKCCHKNQICDWNGSQRRFYPPPHPTMKIYSPFTKIW